MANNAGKEASVFSTVMCLTQDLKAAVKSYRSPGTSLVLLVEMCPNDWFVSRAACVSRGFPLKNVNTVQQGEKNVLILVKVSGSQSEKNRDWLLLCRKSALHYRNKTGTRVTASPTAIRE